MVRHNPHMYKICLSFLAIVLCGVALPAEASHRSGGVDTSDLDDDPVESLAIPVLFGANLADVTPDFGDPRGGGTREHEGQDFIVPQGTPIVSPTEAVVLSTGSGASAGKFVYTAGPGGEIFRYMHLDEIADIDRGDELDVGDFIGTVGDTGNAVPGSYHLHFEVRPDNRPVDPYPRLTDVFTLEEKVDFLQRIFADIDDEDEYAELLVAQFPAELTTALNAEYDLPEEIVEALEAAGIVSQVARLKQLETILASVPKLLTVELREGDRGPMVQLLQLHIMFFSDGPARNALSNAGATGYYGPVTSAAMRAYQAERGVLETGVYDTNTRTNLIK